MCGESSFALRSSFTNGWQVEKLCDAFTKPSVPNFPYIVLELSKSTAVTISSSALAQLLAFYPFGYSLVQRYLHSVIESDVKPEMGITIGVLYERTARGSPFAGGPARYAAYLVRRAVGQRQGLGFAVRSSSRALAAILKREMHTMALVRCDAAYIRYVRAQIQQLESTPSFRYSKSIKRFMLTV